MRLEHSVFIQRSTQDVFAFVSDPANLPRWQSGVAEVSLESEAAGVGSRHVEVRRFMGTRIEQTLEVTAYDPGRELALRVVEGPLLLEVHHTFTAEGDGTRIDVVGEGEVGALFRMAEFLVVRAVKRQSSGDFARLKELLEGGDS
jgi:carbon monoxide dehydrogenase subunit G